MDELTRRVLDASADELRALLDKRPDVLVGAPVESRADLVERLVHVPGVGSALSTVPVPGWQLLTALGALGWRAAPEDVAELLESDDDTLQRWLVALEERALVVLDDDEVVANPGVAAIIGTVPGLGEPARDVVASVAAPELQKVTRRWGLGTPGRKADLVEAVVERLRDPVHVHALLATAPQPVAEHLTAVARYGVQLAQALAGGDAPPTLPAGMRGPAAYRTRLDAEDWARRHGIVFGSRLTGEAVMPSEVTLEIGGPLRLPFDPDEPYVATAPADARQVDSAGAAAAAELLAGTGAVLDHLRTRPATALAAGGVGARELTRIGKVTGLSPRTVRVALELTDLAGLLEHQDRTVTTSAEHDAWRTRPPADRVLSLWAAWTALPVHPSVERDDDGKALPALGRSVPVPPWVRTTVLQAAAAVTPRQGDGPGARSVVDVTALAAACAWRDPGSEVDAEDVEIVWAEAAMLGIVALDAPTIGARAMIDDDLPALRGWLVEHLPAVSTTARLGSDLTVVVAGLPSPEVSDLLDLLADRESRGAASTWRLSPASVRRAFDAGHDADEVLDRLRAIAGTVPQPVEYLVRDVGRRYGHVTVAAAATVLVVPDDALRAEVLAATALRALHLRHVDGTVLASPATPDDVITRLRSAGYLPRALDDGPTVQVSAPPRAERPRLRLADISDNGLDDAAPEPVEPVDVGTVVARLTGAAVSLEYLPVDEAEGQARRDVAGARLLSDLERRHLAWAVARRQPLRIEYRSATGSVTVRVVSQMSVMRDVIVGWCHLRDDERHFRLDSILMVAPL